MQIRYLLGLTIAAMPMASLADTVFSDTFGTSTIDATPTAPTASSTSYEAFTQNGTPSAIGETIAPGDLHFQNFSGTSVLGEVQAQLPDVTLINVGDFVNLAVTFTDTANVLVAGQNSNASLNIGLFNSGGVAPNVGAQLNPASGFLSGGAQNWVGFMGRMFLNGNSSVVTRGAQGLFLAPATSQTTSQNQDLIFDNASSTAGFNDLTGTSLGAGPLGTTAGLTAGSVYTLDFSITLNAAGNEQVNETLLSGSTVLFNTTDNATGANLATSIDGFAIGNRVTDSTAEVSSMDISSIVETAPEPTTIALSGLGAAGLLLARRWKARK
jgi:hypothetical protein